MQGWLRTRTRERTGSTEAERIRREPGQGRTGYRIASERQRRLALRLGGRFRLVFRQTKERSVRVIKQKSGEVDGRAAAHLAPSLYPGVCAVEQLA